MINDVYVGQIIRLEEWDKKEKIIRTYTVTNVYPFHVLMKRYIPKSGAVLKRSLSYGDLITMGLERQPDKYEVMRKSYDLYAKMVK